MGDETSVCCLNVLAAAALKDDIILMLHQDRKHHILMNYAQDIDRLPVPQQKALALFVSVATLYFFVPFEIFFSSPVKFVINLVF